MVTLLAIAITALVAPAAHATGTENEGGRCAQAQAGTLDGTLTGKDAAVTAACAARKAAIQAANQAFDARKAELKALDDAARAAAEAACSSPTGTAPTAPNLSARFRDTSTLHKREHGGGQGTHGGAPSDACKVAREQARATHKDLGKQLRAARRTRHDAVKAARSAFRATIRQLGGESTAPAEPAGGSTTPAA